MKLVAFQIRARLATGTKPVKNCVHQQMGVEEVHEYILGVDAFKGLEG